jgi:hypothetical protein
MVNSIANRRITQKSRERVGFGVFVKKPTTEICAIEFTRDPPTVETDSSGKPQGHKPADLYKQFKFSGSPPAKRQDDP